MTREQERLLLVGVALPGQPPDAVRHHLAELERLVHTAGGTVVGTVMQNRPALDPATLVGSGKVREIAQTCRSLAVDTVVFDDDLTASQVRRLERETAVRVIDRSTVILDIFARHARTREARIQVEIAQLRYSLPRLTRAWTHLSRQRGGGIGNYGPGETQLETDRRLVRTRLSQLERQLADVEEQRAIQLRKRRDAMPTLALAGYTNAGKSSLLNALSRADVLTEDRLFSTLDATSRRVWLGDSGIAVIADTVGFIRKLPHDLVASFRSTLAVIGGADVVLHVVDAADPQRDEEMRVAREVLDSLITPSVPRLVILNKIDQLDGPARSALRAEFPDAVLVSALRGEGLDNLRSAAGHALRRPRDQEVAVA